MLIDLRKATFESTLKKVEARESYERRIKRQYFHVKSLGQNDLATWRVYLDFELIHGDVVCWYDEWRMTNEEWWMTNGEWWMRNGEWWMVNGEWWMRNEEWIAIHHSINTILILMNRIPSQSYLNDALFLVLFTKSSGFAMQNGLYVLLLITTITIHA